MGEGDCPLVGAAAQKGKKNRSDPWACVLGDAPSAGRKGGGGWAGERRATGR